MKKLFFNNTVAKFIGVRQMQPFWEILNKASLFGMNYGGGYKAEESGEAWVLGQFASYLKTTRGARTPVIFDVGANNGSYLGMIRSVMDERVKIYCFEPSPTAFGILRASVGNAANVTVVNCGLSDREGSASLFGTLSGSVVGTLHAGHTSVADMSQAVEECSLTSLDHFCSENSIDHVDFLKVDVEGNELNVLQGGPSMLDRSAVDLIQFEFGEAQLLSRTYLRDLFELLDPKYQMTRVLRAGLRPLKKYNEILEVFRTTNYVAISREKADLLRFFRVG